MFATNMSTSIEDIKGGISSCCGAKMYEDYGICSECKEHCDNVEEEFYTEMVEVELSRAQEAFIRNQEKLCAKYGCDDSGHKHGTWNLNLRQ